MAKNLRDLEIEPDEEREEKQAQQRTQLEEMEDELQQTEDQKRRLEVNMHNWKTQSERDLAEKEEVRDEKRHDGQAAQRPRDRAGGGARAEAGRIADAAGGDGRRAAADQGPEDAAGGEHADWEDPV